MRFTKTLFALLLFASISWADMTIYLKDGSSRQVHKIVFKENMAELYLLDGTLVTLPVSKIDLESSGIFSPVGTYGETKISGRRTAVPRGSPVTDSSMRQAELKTEWEEASVTAVALKDFGSIRRGNTVHAYSPSSAPAKKKYYSWRDDDEPPVNPDQAYIIIYKRPDGTFGKKVLDAATFASNFEIQKPASARPSTPLPLPISPEPAAAPPPREEIKTEPSSEKQEPAPVTEIPPAESSSEEVTEATPSVGTKMEESDSQESSSTILLIIAGLVVGGGGVLVFVLLKKRQKPFVDSSRFGRYEQDLREFELEIWLRHGKTVDQLLEICVKKFYQDFPAALAINLRMLKAEQKGLIISSLIKQTGQDATQAETLYNNFQMRVGRIRKLIEEVSSRTGLSPVQPFQPKESSAVKKPEPVTAATGPSQNPARSVAELPRAASIGTATVVPPPLPAQATPPVVQASVPIPAPATGTSSVVVVGEPFPIVSGDQKKTVLASSDLPSYALAVFSQLALLSNPEE